MSEFATFLVWLAALSGAVGLALFGVVRARSRPCAVYEIDILAPDGQVRCWRIGHTSDIKRRMGEYRRTADWWPYALPNPPHRLRWFPTKAHAERHERTRVGAVNPPANVHYRTDLGRSRQYAIPQRVLRRGRAVRPQVPNRLPVRGPSSRY